MGTPSIDQIGFFSQLGITPKAEINPDGWYKCDFVDRLLGNRPDAFYSAITRGGYFKQYQFLIRENKEKGVDGFIRVSGRLIKHYLDWRNGSIECHEVVEPENVCDSTDEIGDSSKSEERKPEIRVEAEDLERFICQAIEQGINNPKWLQLAKIASDYYGEEVKIDRLRGVLIRKGDKTPLQGLSKSDVVERCRKMVEQTKPMPECHQDYPESDQYDPPNDKQVSTENQPSTLDPSDKSKIILSTDHLKNAPHLRRMAEIQAQYPGLKYAIVEGVTLVPVSLLTEAKGLEHIDDYSSNFAPVSSHIRLDKDSVGYRLKNGSHSNLEAIEFLANMPGVEYVYQVEHHQKLDCFGFLIRGGTSARNQNTLWYKIYEQIPELATRNKIHVITWDLACKYAFQGNSEFTAEFTDAQVKSANANYRKEIEENKEKEPVATLFGAAGMVAPELGELIQNQMVLNQRMGAVEKKVDDMQETLEHIKGSINCIVEFTEKFGDDFESKLLNTDERCNFSAEVQLWGMQQFLDWTQGIGCCTIAVLIKRSFQENPLLSKTIEDYTRNFATSKARKWPDILRNLLIEPTPILVESGKWSKLINLHHIDNQSWNSSRINMFPCSPKSHKLIHAMPIMPEVIRDVISKPLRAYHEMLEQRGRYIDAANDITINGIQDCA